MQASWKLGIANSALDVSDGEAAARGRANAASVRVRATNKPTRRVRRRLRRHAGDRKAVPFALVHLGYLCGDFGAFESKSRIKTGCGADGIRNVQHPSVPSVLLVLLVPSVPSVLSDAPAYSPASSLEAAAFRCYASCVTRGVKQCLAGETPASRWIVERVALPGVSSSVTSCKRSHGAGTSPEVVRALVGLDVRPRVSMSDPDRARPVRVFLRRPGPGRRRT